MQNRLPKKPFCWLVTMRRSNKAATSEIGPTRKLMRRQRISGYRGTADPLDSRNGFYGMSGRPPDHSGLMFANLITLPHFSVSSAMSLP
jgi:hypothetical protein